MKKMILGVGMFIGGILGIVGVMLTTAIAEKDGIGGFGLTDCIGFDGAMPYFIVFCFFVMIGLIIAVLEARNP
jgi:hypothetical protein